MKVRQERCCGDSGDPPAVPLLFFVAFVLLLLRVDRWTKKKSSLRSAPRSPRAPVIVTEREEEDEGEKCAFCGGRSEQIESRRLLQTSRICGCCCENRFVPPMAHQDDFQRGSDVAQEVRAALARCGVDAGPQQAALAVRDALVMFAERPEEVRVHGPDSKTSQAVFGGAQRVWMTEWRNGPRDWGVLALSYADHPLEPDTWYGQDVCFFV